jgi:hypothetical protein
MDRNRRVGADPLTVDRQDLPTTSLRRVKASPPASVTLSFHHGAEALAGRRQRQASKTFDWLAAISRFTGSRSFN